MFFLGQSADKYSLYSPGPSWLRLSQHNLSFKIIKIKDRLIDSEKKKNLFPGIRLKMWFMDNTEAKQYEIEVSFINLHRWALANPKHSSSDLSRPAFGPVGPVHFV